jgi:hypothetical protein
MFFINPFIYAGGGDFESIATVTVGSGGAANIEFTSIPGGFQHLQVRGIFRDNRANSGNGSYGLLTMNGTGGTSYAFHQLIGDGSSATAYGAASQSSIEVARIADAGAAASIFGAFVIDILDYASTSKNKTVRAFAGYDRNGGGASYVWSGLLASTSAVTSLKIADGGGTLFSQYSDFALYGVRA